jgi:hypothetical protein
VIPYEASYDPLALEHKSICPGEALHAWESWTKDPDRRGPFAMPDVGLIFEWFIANWLDRRRDRRR